MTAAPRPAVAPGRLALLDALRGVAALSVVVYHVYGQNLARHARAPLPEPLHALFTHGYLGVYVFFVLSGFVIAHSVGDGPITAGYVGRFALRRSLRLDPPYWAAIAAAVAVAALAGPQLGQPRALPSPAALGAHVLYLQQALGYDHILGVFWTLCLEIQFYLAYVLLLLAARRLAGGRAWALALPLLAVGLLAGAEVVALPRALFVWAWPFFFLGVVTAWALGGRAGRPAWAAVVAATLVVARAWPLATGVAVATAAVLYLAGQPRAGGSRLRTVTLGRALQGLGTISYSLYLTHLLVGAKSARLGIRLLGGGPLGAGAVVALLLGCVAVSVAAAVVMYALVERPAQRLSRRVALRPPGAAAVEAAS